MTVLQAGKHSLRIGGVTHVMAVINLSPESKNLGTVATGPQQALAMASGYRQAGASIIDIGGQSSHYDNPTISADEELARLLPAVELLVNHEFVVSVDTWKPAVAAACIDAGAAIVNDTGGLTQPAMVAAIAASDVAAVMVYVEGSNPHDVGEIEGGPNKAERTAAVLSDRLDQLARTGVDKVIIDPGIALN
jgi:dihydropteroate synthase